METTEQQIETPETVGFNSTLPKNLLDSVWDEARKNERPFNAQLRIIIREWFAAKSARAGQKDNG